MAEEEELTEEEYEELMKYMTPDGKLNGLLEKRAVDWPKGWRLIDPNLGRRKMVMVGKVTPEKYETRREEIEARVKRKEGEDDEAFLLRKMILYNRIRGMWKPGESGNPGGAPKGVKRAKKLPITVKVALDEQMRQAVKIMIEEEGQTPRQVKISKKELIARNIVDMVALGRVEFPDAKHPTRTRVVELNGRDWSANALKLLKMINPKPMEETEEVVQTISFDIQDMMPVNAKMKVVKKITGKDYSNELEYLNDEEAVEGIIDYIPEDNEEWGDIEELEDEMLLEESVWEDSEEWEGEEGEE